MIENRGTLMLVVTNNCNLNCVYCYEKHKPKSVMSIDTAKHFINKYLTDSEYDYLEISIFGGEPFLCFDIIKEICEWTWQRDWIKQYIFYISTNGTILSSEIKHWLAHNKNRIFVALSLDGTKSSHDINRSNSFDSIDINFFLQNWTEIFVKMTISEFSLSNLANDVIYVHSLGFKIQECNLAFGLNWSNEKNINILKNELKKLYDFYIDNPSLEPAPIIDMKIGACENPKAYLKWCGTGKQLMTIDVDGQSYPCHFLTPMSFSKDDLDILLKTDFSEIRKLVDLDCYNNCYIYPICPTCYASDFLMTKSINTKDKTICNLMKIRALFSAALQAQKIINSINNKDDENFSTFKTIQAIKNIKLLYSEI